MRLRGRVMAVVWEQWRCVRLVLALTMWTGLIVSWLFSRPRVLHYIQLVFSDFAFGLTLFWLAGFGVFLLADTNRMETLLFRPPTRQWRMPIRRGEFLTLYLLVRLFAMGLLAAVLGGGVAAMEPTPERSLLPQLSGNITWFVAFAVVSLASAFAVAWNAGHLFRTSTGVIPTAIGWLVALAAVFAVFMDRFLEASFMIKWGAIITVCCVPVAVLGALRFDRRALTEYLWPARAQSRGARYWPGRFRSPAEAQAWYDWSRHGLVLPVAVLVGLGLWLAITVCGHLWGTCLCWPVVGVNGFGHFGVALCLRGWILLGPMAFAAGLYRVSQEWHEARSNRTVYARLMPMSRATVTSVRLASTRRSVGLTGLLLGMCMVAGIVMCTGIGPLSGSGTETLKLLVLPAWGVEPLLATLTAMILAWTIYWLTVPVLMLMLWASFVFAGGFVMGLVFGNDMFFLSERVQFDLLVLVPCFLALYLVPGMAERTVQQKRLNSDTVALVAALPIAPLLLTLLIRMVHATPNLFLNDSDAFVVLGAVVVVLGLAIRFGLRLIRGRIRCFSAIATGCAVVCVLLVLAHFVLLANGHGEHFWGVCALVAGSFLPVVAALHQGYWVNRLWCR